MATPKNWKGVVERFNALPKPIRNYFKHLPALIEDFPWEVALAYAFSRVELAHNMALYCGAVKLHRANGELTKAVVQEYHITRSGFQSMFKTIHGREIPEAARSLIASAEDIRDRALHGKRTTEVEHRKALCDLFEYAQSLNKLVQARSGFKPFDDLRGFKGRAKALDKSTTRWLVTPSFFRTTQK